MNNFFIDFRAAKIFAGAFSSQATINNLNTAISEGNMNISKIFSLKNNQ